MRAARRPVKMKTAPRRAKSDTSNELTVEPSGFVRNEWLETLSRIRQGQPKRYAREVSAGLQVTVGKYERTKAAHERGPARGGEGREADGWTNRMRGKGTPRPGERPAAQAGTRMLVMPPSPADPMRLAGEQVESLKRERPLRPVKTSRKKPKRRGGIGAPRPSHSQGTS